MSINNECKNEIFSAFLRFSGREGIEADGKRCFVLSPCCIYTGSLVLRKSNWEQENVGIDGKASKKQYFSSRLVMTLEFRVGLPISLMTMRLVWSRRVKEKYKVALQT